MWAAYQSLKMYHRRPSDDLKLTESISAWSVDGCVLWFGITLENALLEQYKVGNESRDRYTLTQLLDPTFKLPAPAREPRKGQQQTSNTPLATVLALAGQPGSNVKKYAYVGPAASLPN